MSDDPFYKTALWRAVRVTVLRRDRKCSVPGCYRGSVHVDHIVPRSRGGSDELHNLRGLCASCHARKTASIDRVGGSGRIRLPGCDANGNPSDPHHDWNK
ncbi:MAG: HNH endonuclease [Alphaproteobacteria bacterium]|nr:HNH endonuclease [Alphaproteobacteria bacterium]